MDNLTHSLTGLMLSRAGLNRFYPRATLVAILAANIPDIDGFSLFGGTADYLRFHRGYAHSFICMPLMAIVPALIGLLVGRSWRGWARAYAVSFIAVLSHVLLDWTNSYGIRLLLPFSSAWLHADLVSVIDFWLWAVLIVAWVWPWLARLVSSEIGARSGPGRGLAVAVLVFMVAYDYGRYVLHTRAMNTLEARMYDGRLPMRVGAFPGPGNPFRWNGWIETAVLYKRFKVNVTGEFDPGAGVTIYKPTNLAAVAAARQTPAFRVMQYFDQFPVWREVSVPEPEGATKVELMDARLGFTATAVVDRGGRVIGSGLGFGR